MTLKRKTLIFSSLAFLIICASILIFQAYRSINHRLINTVLLLDEIKHAAQEIGTESMVAPPDLPAIRQKINTIPELSRKFQDVLREKTKSAGLIDLEISFVRINRAIDKSLPGMTLEKPLQEQIRHEIDQIETAADALILLSRQKIETMQSEAEILIFVLSVTLIGYIMGVLYFLSRQVIRPILTLSQQLSEFRAGKRTEIPALPRRDEIGRLNAFARKTIAELAQKNSALKNEILEKKKTEERYKLSATTLENVLNSANPLCITNVDFQLVLANSSYYEVWPKRSTNNDEKINCYDSRPGSLCHTEQCPLVQIIQGEKVVRVEAAKHEEGCRRYEFIVTARPFLGPDGTLIGMVESFQDITVRKQAEETLASERESLAVTLRSIGEGVITTDTEGRIVLLNKIAENLTGWRQDEAMGRPMEEVFQIITSATEPCRSPSPLTQILQSGEIIEFTTDTTLKDKDGTIREIVVSGAPIKKEQISQVVGMVLVFRDVTEENRLEQELLKVRKLESIGILAGGIAHDFNNILTGIMGNLNLASLLAKPGDEIYELLLEAEKASVRAKGLTRQLLTFSKGGTPIKKLSSVTDIIKDSAQFVLRGKTIRCDYHFSADLWPVEIDTDQISQVIQNIILNASHAMPEGGVISIACENYHQGRNASLPIQENRLLKIAIHDQGEGIPPEIVEKIFDPYFSTKEEGSGLGLAICHSIISKHGGHLTVDSQEGRGTTVTLYLVASSAKITAKRQNKDDPTAPIPLGKIMIMDDEEMVRRIVEKMLIRNGFEVVQAREGQEAIELYKKIGPAIALVIMDITIPGGMGGKEAAQKILAINPDARLIVSSGYSNDPIMSDYQNFGFMAAIVKPYTIQKLTRTVRQVLLSSYPPGLGCTTQKGPHDLCGPSS